MPQMLQLIDQRSPHPCRGRGLRLFGGAAGPAARAAGRVLLALSVGEC